MANYCQNTITIKGDKFALKTISDIIDMKSDLGLFERLIGIKPGMTRAEYSSAWYQANIDHWGCRTDVDVEHEFSYHFSSDTELVLCADSVYSPPIPFGQNVCKTYGVEIDMFYYGQEDDFCGMTRISKDGCIDEEDYEYLDGLYVFGEMDLFWSEVESRMESHIEYCENFDVEEFIENNVKAVSESTQNEIREMFSEMLKDYSILN